MTVTMAMTMTLDALPLLFPSPNSTSFPACVHSLLLTSSGKQVLGSLTLESGIGRCRGRGRGRGSAIALFPIFWMNAGNRKTISSSSSDSAAPENPVDDCGGESGHELPLVKESLQKTHKDIGMGRWTGLANEEHLSVCQGSVASKVNVFPVNEVHDMGDSVDITDEMHGASTEIDGKRRHLEEEYEEKGTRKLFLTKNKVQELGHEGSFVSQMSTYSKIHDTEVMVINEACKSSTARSSISFPTVEPSLLGNLCSVRQDEPTENDFGVDTLRPSGYNIKGNGHNNLIVSERLKNLCSSNEKSDMFSSDGASVEYPMSKKVEGYSQHRLYHESHEGSLPIPINQDIATANITQNETTLLLVKKEAWNSSDTGNGLPISQAASVGSVKKMGIWYKSHSHSTDSDIELKDLLPFDSTKDGSEYMRYYDCWLRVGRFKDCLELLECMNRVGALDMNKVYHAKFLEICREKQAVQEAFRFVKLIENPTLSTFNMLLAVCASAGDVEGAFQVLPLVKKMGLKADCKLYTALISSCAKGGKVDIMFKVFHEMVNAGIEPTIYTYGALIDGCARAGQVAKAFGVYGIMRSKKMKPDRVIFNALITTCGRAGAVDRAFDILSEMRAEPHPLDPDHVTVGALINACSLSGQVDRALEVYKMVQKHGIKGTAEVYTMAVSACSQNGDLDFALSVYGDMRKKGVCPDEVFFSALINAAGHAGDIDFGFKILHDAKDQGLMPGNVMYSSLMGACSNLEDGDIICFQRAVMPDQNERFRYPHVRSFLEYMRNRQIVHFRRLDKPKEDDFCLELSKLNTYDDVVEKVAEQLGLDDPSKIRLTSHNCYSQQPKPQSIKHRGFDHLTDMLVHYNQTCDILYYEVLDIPLSELQGLKSLKVTFQHAMKDEVSVHVIRLPKHSTVSDVLRELKTKVELSNPNTDLRLLEIFYHKIYKVFPQHEKIENINDQYWTLRAEEIPEEEKNLGMSDRLIHVYHFDFAKDASQNHMIQNFGEPFFLVIHDGETLAEVKERIKKKLQVPDEEFVKWKFAFLSLGRPEYFQDTDIVFNRFQRRDIYGAWEQYLGMEHSDNGSRRNYQSIQSRHTFEKSVKIYN